MHISILVRLCRRKTLSFNLKYTYVLVGTRYKGLFEKLEFRIIC